ncbi:MAG TPA: TIGR00266 family protein [Thermoanaerobaculia bacterium]|nr:TIGR00266 family protein [Thermoanaerobaculia bacterium]
MNQGSDFRYTIDGKPDFSFLSVEVPAGRMLKVEASAMAAMSTNMKMKTKMRGGFSRFLTGESIFINEFTADGGAGEIQIAPGSPGDMDHVALVDQTMYLQSSAFVAASAGVNVESKWQGLMKGFFSGEGLFLIRCSGRGDLWFNTYGAMIRLDVKDDFVVDTNYVVAFTEGLQYDVRRIGGYKSLFFSGEGLVCRFSGSGTLWIQTRQMPAFASWVWPFRPAKKSK